MASRPREDGPPNRHHARTPAASAQLIARRRRLSNSPPEPQPTTPHGRARWPRPDRSVPSPLRPRRIHSPPAGETRIRPAVFQTATLLTAHRDLELWPRLIPPSPHRDSGSKGSSAAKDRCDLRCRNSASLPAIELPCCNFDQPTPPQPNPATFLLEADLNHLQLSQRERPESNSC